MAASRNVGGGVVSDRRKLPTIPIVGGLSGCLRCGRFGGGARTALLSQRVRFVE